MNNFFPHLARKSLTQTNIIYYLKSLFIVYDDYIVAYVSDWWMKIINIELFFTSFSIFFATLSCDISFWEMPLCDTWGISVAES